MPVQILQFFKKSYSLALITVFSLLFANKIYAAPDGKALFQANCASCHNPLKDATGPALQNVDKRVPSKEWIYKWVHGSGAVIAGGDKYANDLFSKWKANMTAFPGLSNDEIDAIVKYVDDYKAPGAATAGTPAAGANSGEDENNSWLYTIITLGLLVLSIVLWRVNRTLKNAAAQKTNQPYVKDIPLYRNKLVIALVGVLAFFYIGYRFANGAIGLGREKNYMPKQPIFYSHKVHAGINQINCLYCHAGAEKSRQAMIPSSNVCMNCHKQINEYTGTEKLVTLEGKEVNGTNEIKKLYEYAGWDPAKKEYKRDAKGAIMATPIQWTKIHNLPDHVYFNHSQHVKVGQVNCQRCHGPIQEMDEVKQFADLSMGWCINCHRQTEVKFKDNNYYSIFEKYHQEIKDKKRDGVTVEDIGGIECQKCHY